MNLEKFESASDDECILEITITDEEQAALGLVEMFNSLAQQIGPFDEVPDTRPAKEA